MSRLEISIRQGVSSDVDAIVAVHRSAFSGFYLDRMGKRFLRVYYECALSNSSVICLVATNRADQICGFVVGFTNPGSFYREFRLARRRLVVPATLAIFRNPSVIVESVLNVLRVSRQAQVDRAGSFTELVSIGVSGDGKGLGSSLLRSFISQALRREVKEIRLTTNKHDNDRVNDFYVKHGFEASGEEIRGSRILNEYSLRISDLNSGAYE